LKIHPFWWETVPSRPIEALPLPARADVVVVGAGYTGLAAARQLARAGVTVVVLERERIGWGASSRNAGQVIPGLRLDPVTLVTRYGAARARELFDVSLASIASLEALLAEEAIECNYERSGHFQAAAKPSHFEAFGREQEVLARVFDYRVALVPREHQHAEIASERYHGLLVDERSAALNPAKYVSGLAASTVRSGASVLERTAVERVVRTGARWIVTTTRGVIDAGDILVATNGYTDGAAAPELRRRLVPIGSYIVVSEPLSIALLPKRRTVFDSKHFLYYFRLTPDERLLFGGRAEFGRLNAASVHRAAGILRRAMTEVFPQLAGVRLEYAWGGNVAFTRDEMPHAGRLNGAYFAGGYGGHGVAMATHLGGLIARRMAGERFEHPLIDQPFPAIPLYYGRPWFLPLVGAYYRFKDLVD
jgi:glycine/D-amino acid oxidase-like deaminating enzyme